MGIIEERPEEDCNMKNEPDLEKRGSRGVGLSLRHHRLSHL